MHAYASSVERPPYVELPARVARPGAGASVWPQLPPSGRLPTLRLVVGTVLYLVTRWDDSESRHGSASKLEALAFGRCV
jgi:hypothetical protein